MVFKKSKTLSYNYHSVINGIYFTKDRTRINVVCYVSLVSSNLLKLANVIQHFIKRCNSMSIKICFESSRKLCEFGGDTNNILYRFIYKNIFFSNSNERDEFKNILMDDKKFGITHLSSDIPFIQEKLNYHSYGLYRFLWMTLNNKLIENNYESTIFNFSTKTIIININQNRLMFNFITNKPLNYDPFYISNFVIQNKRFSAFANEFFCSDIITVLRLVFHQFKRSKIKKNNIHHPCLPNNININLLQESIFSRCGLNSYVPKNMIFYGDFNLKRCQNLIYFMLYNRKLCTNNKGCNLSDFKNINLFKDFHHIMFINSWFEFNRSKIDLFLDTIYKSISNFCYNVDAFTANNFHNRILIDCFNSVFLFTIFSRIRDSNKHLSITAIHSLHEYDDESMYILGDYRLGIITTHQSLINLTRVTNNLPLKVSYFLTIDTDQLQDSANMLKIIFHYKLIIIFLVLSILAINLYIIYMRIKLNYGCIYLFYY